jgi:hypothetical protein
MKLGRCASPGICICVVAWLSVCNVESLVVIDTAGKTPLLRGTQAAFGQTKTQMHSALQTSRRAESEIGLHKHTSQPLKPLRGGSGITKKLGAKNIGLLMVLLSILYAPSAMGACSARIYYVGKDPKVQRMGCGVLFMLNNIVTLIGISLVLANSRKFDRYGRSKFKMRLTGSLIIFMGMMLVIAHAGF